MLATLARATETRQGHRDTGQRPPAGPESVAKPLPATPPGQLQWQTADLPSATQLSPASSEPSNLTGPGYVSRDIPVTISGQAASIGESGKNVLPPPRE